MRTKFSGFLTLLLVLIVQLGFAQEKTITGTVLDGDGLPLPGATVQIKGKSIGTQTDFDGKYEITASTGEVLVFTYVGFKTQEITVSNQTTIDVTLSLDAQTLDEVVVVGFGIKKERRELIYNTETVDSEVMNMVQPTTASSGLVGKVAGLQINIQNNGVKPSTQVILRGLTSISASNEAAVVIDGSLTNQNAFDALNPNDIESINVLKGASAAVLYGSSAGNGVLVVTTKKGNKNKKFTVGLNSVATFEEVSYMPEFQTEYGSGWQGDYNPIENTNWGPRFDGTMRQIGPTFSDGSYQSVKYAPIANNLRDFYNTGETYQNTVYFSGGDETSSFYASIGKQSTTGTVPKDTFEKTMFRVNASKTIGNLTLNLNTNYYRDETSVVGSTIGSQDRPLYWFILNTPANIPLSRYSDWRNDFYSSPNGYYNGYYQNPYWALDTNRNNDWTDRFTANLSGSWDPYKWLNVVVRLGLNKVQGHGKEWRAEQTYSTDDMIAFASRPDAVSSFVVDNSSQALTYTADLLATGTFDLNDDFNLKTIVGTTQNTYHYHYNAIQANNLSIPGFYDVSNGTGTPDVVVDEAHTRRYAFLSDITLGYKKWLYANVSARYDYTSTLSKGDNNYLYPGGGISFVLTDAVESLKSDILSFAKLSVNNSTVYNDLSAYRINETYSSSSGFPFGDLAGFALSSQTIDENIKKEKLNTSEITLDLSLFKNRLNVTASAYKIITTDLITAITPSYASGATSYLTNIGELENNGLELSLNGTVLKTQDFSWNLNLNITHQETVVNEISDGVTETAVSTNGSVGVYAVEGEAFPQIKGISYERDDQGRIVIDADTGRPIIGDLKNLGKTTPDYTVGLVSVMKYKGFTLSATLDYRTGHVYYSQLADRMEFTGRSMASVSANRQDFVLPNSVINTGTSDNPVYVENTNIAVTGGLQSYWTDHYNLITENYVFDATAVKLRELALNYSFSPKLLDGTFINKLSLGLVARNLLTWLPKENRFSDPEFNNSNSNAIGIGGYSQSPPTRTFGVNLNVEF
ncbi:SusC/RagA family TonB-linked outer membrane protein [Neptunitalea chrysea]|uniref:SusC/RagA family TonB-linked outer membrane protein n=1 Tax=Neptunitalea chrysea TaxID=1647581 RepID=A0A9W6B898_9FLAO|nr:SusC/RagA family TonB-linked outer membrane protein [Neptunitalea chrysea]GLB53322.1 SusC/RagA family TonB-linked outer membrane protein [Neptunitalea chrysea]